MYDVCLGGQYTRSNVAEMASCRKAGSNSASRARAERSWKEYFKDPSLWWDNRNTKTNPMAPDFRHRLTKESLLMHNGYNPSWVQDTLRLEKAEEPCSMKAQEEVNAWERLSLEEALASLDEGMPPLPSVEDFACILHKCRMERNRSHALRLHAHMRKGGLEAHTSLGNHLVSMLVEVGSMSDAEQVFDGLVYRGERSWNSLITGYVQHGKSQHALTLYQKMQEDGSLHPSAYTFVALLKACTKLKNLQRGSNIHVEIAKKGLVERNLFVGNALVDMYAKCGFLAEAQEVFDIIPVRDAVLWTALIAGYTEHGCGEEALKCFQQMQHEGISPDAVTFVCGLKACGSIKATTRGREIHAEIARIGLEGELFIGNTLVDMYAKCGSIAEAQDVFDNHSVRSMVSWNALITAYGEHGYGEEALHCFEQMQHEGVSPDSVTFICSLKACGSVGATDKGQEIHAEIARKGLERDLVIGSTLVDMYAKCGSLAKAQEVFDKLLVQDVVSWTALIAGYAQRGESEKVFHMFDRMIREGIKPNLVTFVSVLNVCNHAGLVDKGEMYFELMSKDYGVMPTRKHYTCLIDLLGRAGHVDKAVAMIKKMPFHPGIVVWHTVLAACRKWGNVELGRQAFEHTLRLDEKDAGAYICMSNIYANAGMQEEANKVEARRVEKQAWLKPGHSWWTDAIPFDWE